MKAPGRGATQDYSRALSARPALRVLLLLGGLAGGGLLIAADLAPLYEVRVVTVTRATVSGHAQHSYALVLVGLVALPLALAATRSRAAMLAVSVLGLLALAVAGVAGDFHDVHSAGTIGALYESASARPKSGFYFETLGGVLLLAGGLGALLASRGGPATPGAAGARPAEEAVVAAPAPRRRPAPPPPDSAPDPGDWFR